MRYFHSQAGMSDRISHNAVNKKKIFFAASLISVCLFQTLHELPVPGRLQSRQSREAGVHQGI